MASVCGFRTMKKFEMKIKLLLFVILIFSSMERIIAQDQVQGTTIDTVSGNKGRNHFEFNIGFGGALVRNEIAPTFHINLGLRHKEFYEATVNTTSIFFFTQGDNGKYNVYRNTFINAEFLLNFNMLSKSVNNWNGGGIGYLVEARGRYFSETAMQLYYKRKFRYFSVMPALIFDDNFKDVWPMITIRL
jgi:hypothetical protein